MNDTEHLDLFPQLIAEYKRPVKQAEKKEKALHLMPLFAQKIQTGKTPPPRVNIQPDRNP